MVAIAVIDPGSGLRPLTILSFDLYAAEELLNLSSTSDQPLISFQNLILVTKLVSNYIKNRLAK